MTLEAFDHRGRNHLLLNNCNYNVVEWCLDVWSNERTLKNHIWVTVVAQEEDR